MPIGTLQTLGKMGRQVLWVQGAWSDSRTGQLSLTAAETVAIDVAAYHLAPVEPRLVCVYWGDLSASEGILRPESERVPVQRYE